MANYNFRYTNEKCPVCNETFKSDDDIVVCPLCGTPHHRECYKQNTKCANHHKHGDFLWEPTFVTPEETKIDEAQKEEKTIKTPWGDEIDASQLPPNMPFPFIRANPLEQFPKNLEDDVTTEDMAYFVQQDVTKYISKFFKIKEGKRTINFAALFLAPYWFFYRKMYKLGAIFMAIFLCLSCLSILPPALKFSNAMFAQEERIEELSQSLTSEEEYEKAVIELSEEMTAIINENKAGIALVFAQSTLALIISIVIGLNANKWYYKYAIKEIRNEKAKSEVPSAPHPYEKGGVSYGHAGLSLLAEKTIVFLIEIILSATIL